MGYSWRTWRVQVFVAFVFRGDRWTPSAAVSSPSVSSTSSSTPAHDNIIGLCGCCFRPWSRFSRVVVSNRYAETGSHGGTPGFGFRWEQRRKPRHWLSPRERIGEVGIDLGLIISCSSTTDRRTFYCALLLHQQISSLIRSSSSSSSRTREEEEATTTTTDNNEQQETKKRKHAEVPETEEERAEEEVVCPCIPSC